MKIFKYLSLLTLCFFVVNPMFARQSANEEEVDWTAIIEKINEVSQELQTKTKEARLQGNMLGVLTTLREMEQAYKDEADLVKQVYQTDMMIFSSFLGNHADALQYHDLKSEPREEPMLQSSELDSYHAQRALDVLEKLAESTQVIFINEAHHISQHRAFTLQLLHRLRDAGFSYFAAEDFNEEDVDLNKRGYPIVKSGYYINDPVFGNMVRTAIALGYELVPYETTGGMDETQEERERGQAENLVQRILKDDPDAKIVVHAGYGHINEAGTIADAQPMAVHFKELSGINPLTINQTIMRERGDASYEHPLYRYVTEQGWIETPTIFLSPEGAYWSLDSEKWDLMLFHPRSRYEQGRPSWMHMEGLRTPYELKEDVCKGAKTCMVSARYPREFQEAVPVDRVEVYAGQTPAALYLPAGTFTIQVTDVAGHVIQEFQTTIDTTQ